jgi:phosphoglycolate phosphatase
LNPPFTIIFDLDGTLVDTAADLTATLNVVLKKENLQTVSLQTARPLIGKGAKALIEKGLQLNKVSYDETKLALLTEHFIQYYSAHIADHSTVHPDLRAALDEFTRQGVNLGVCTNKRTPLALQLLKAISLDHYFKAIIGSGELPFSKPDPRMLQVAITESEGVVEHAVLVGDNETDVETARNAKVPIILVDFGYTSSPARELGADAVISQWTELEAAIKALKLL